MCYRPAFGVVCAILLVYSVLSPTENLSVAAWSSSETPDSLRRRSSSMSRKTPQTRQQSVSHEHRISGSTVRQQSMRKFPSNARTTSSIVTSSGGRLSMNPGFVPPRRERRMPAITRRCNAGERARTFIL